MYTIGTPIFLNENQVLLEIVNAKKNWRGCFVLFLSNLALKSTLDELQNISTYFCERNNFHGVLAPVRRVLVMHMQLSLV